MPETSPECIFVAALCIILVSCGTLKHETGSWEGIQNNTLRVFVHYEYPYDFDGRINPAAKELLLESGRARAEILLLSYMRMHVFNGDRFIACQQMIADIVAAGTLRDVTCNAQNCEAYIDFDVTFFLKAAGIHGAH